MSRLDQLLAKLKRANDHIRDFEEALAAFLNADPYSFVIDDDTKPGERTYKIVPAQRPPVHLSLIAGDAIHNLRSVLDHMVCHLVTANGNAINGATAFPIHQAPPKGKMADSAKVNGVTPLAIDLIEACQPYMTLCDDLWELHQLDIADKHQLLLLVCAIPIRAVVTISDGTPNSAFLQFTMPFTGPIPDDGAEIGGLLGIPDPKMHENLNLTVDVTFIQPEIVNGDSVLHLLKKQSNLVEGIIRSFSGYLQ